MKIERTTSLAIERCEINLELDFATRTEALNYIADVETVSKAIRDEVYNADEPCVWVHFRVAGKPTLLGIQLSQ